MIGARYVSDDDAAPVNEWRVAAPMSAAVLCIQLQ